MLEGSCRHSVLPVQTHTVLRSIAMLVSRLLTSAAPGSTILLHSRDTCTYAYWSWSMVLLSSAARPIPQAPGAQEHAAERQGGAVAGRRARHAAAGAGGTRQGAGGEGAGFRWCCRNAAAGLIQRILP